MTLSFQSLGLSEAAINQLETLGFTTPTTIQIQAIPQLLAGRDVVGQSQTGTGKTAAFSLPMLERIDTENRAVQALILTPTRELASQVAEAIRTFSSNRRLSIVTVCGGQSMERQVRSLQRGAQIVVGTPGRVIDLLDRRDLKLDNVSWVVLDEADEMLSMGFIDDVKKILKQAPVERQTACFSATMPRPIRELVNKFLKSPATVTVEQPKATPSRIEQRVYIVPRGWTKAKALQPILELEDPEAALIFVRTRRAAAELTSQLQAAGHSVDEYHGDLSQSQRERLLSRFRAGQVRWVVATDIAARGLDVDHLTHVINYDLPDQVESYIHRIGRTGRAGKTGIAISLISSFERRKLNLIERKVRQTLNVSPIPTRSQIESRRLEKLQEQLREALSGERMASFLPVVRDMSEEYDPHAIAAAALQMVYDQTQPAWMAPDFEPPVERPKIIKRRIDKPQTSSATPNHSR
ncbi:DEAD/DEAH box helicase [Microcoleus sp. FACHB-SPT15]|jgi:ATP-dependent RNA helicase DeaD|uniref:DEAD/DEAH box helicase n=1 Tax=Microcoleus sp. FACHB-SPT15 TaxID=2692830 RepID=UPI00178517D7|nr:DEAD/DEAH box helicase [Microcoleus sp. FACHB-SPT15]MBD1807366.1 DEAD/DEAH box helicase [Microcoleus sp. FACHB-SPT15]